jgi:protein-disulfide isomerase
MVFALAALLCPAVADELRLPDVPPVIARVGGEDLTSEAIETEIAAAAAEARQAFTEARDAAIEEAVERRMVELEAAQRGMSAEALLQLEIEGKVAPPDAKAIDAWIQENKARIPKGMPAAEVRRQVADLLREPALGERYAAFLGELRATYKPRLLAEPVRVSVPRRADAPTKGADTAAVEIVEFADFQCPFCARAAESVRQVLAGYGDQVRVTYRHLPLGFHEHAQGAAEASECANQQGKFWAFHDALYSNPAALDANGLRRQAAAVGVDLTVWDACVATGGGKAGVAADMQAAEAAGVSGTPAFFLNGRMLSGAQPADAFRAIIEDELERHGDAR